MQCGGAAGAAAVCGQVPLCQMPGGCREGGAQQGKGVCGPHFLRCMVLWVEGDAVGGE